VTDRSLSFLGRAESQAPYETKTIAAGSLPGSLQRSQPGSLPGWIGVGPDSLAMMRRGEACGYNSDPFAHPLAKLWNPRRIKRLAYDSVLLAEHLTVPSATSEWTAS
jgi:hypothetical protein